MSENAKPLFVGSVKSRKTKSGLSSQKIYLRAADLALMKDNLSDSGFVTLNLYPRKEPSEKGHTHTLSIDTWKPDPKKKKGEDVSLEDVEF